MLAADLTIQLDCRIFQLIEGSKLSVYFM